MKTEREKSLKRVYLAAEKMRRRLEVFVGAVAAGREKKIESAWKDMEVSKDALNEVFGEWLWTGVKIGGTSEE